MKLNHLKIVSIGWILVLTYGALWGLEAFIAFATGGLTAAEYWGTFFALGLMFLLPVVIPFFLYSAVIMGRRALATAGRKRVYWALLTSAGLALFGYFAWAATKIHWE